MMSNEIFDKYQSQVLKRCFSVENEGLCVKYSVVDRVLREMLEELEQKNTERPKDVIYDFWDVPIK